MELYGLETDEPLTKRQMTVIKQQSYSRITKTLEQKAVSKTITPSTVPNNTLQSNQCQYAISNIQ